jgi:AP-3 complex subunit mu
MKLLGEMMDNGIPFTTEPNSLMEIVPSAKGILKLVKSKYSGIKKWVDNMTGTGSMSGVLPDGSLTNTPWRKAGVKYATNEIYFDIIEEIDATIDS